MDKYIPKLFFEKYIKYSYTVNDSNIKNTIKYMIKEYEYVCCPHSVCAVYGALKFMNESFYNKNDNVSMIAIATAHPAKFEEIINECVNNDSSIDVRMYEYALIHKFLPKKGEKEYCIKLKIDNDYRKKWKNIIVNDIVKTCENIRNGKIKSKL